MRTDKVHERIKKYALTDTEEICAELGFTFRGLRGEQIEQYRRMYGKNETMTVQSDSLFRCIFHAFVNPFSLILLVIALISFVTALLMRERYGDGITTGIIILVMLAVSGILRLVQEMRAKRVTERLSKMVHTTVSVLREGRWQEIPYEDIVVGDVVRMEAGDRIPADIRLFRTKDLFVSQSMITGESKIFEKNTQKLIKIPDRIGDYTNTVFLGATVTGGTGRGIVLAVGSDTAYGSSSTVSVDKKKSFDMTTNSIAWVLVKFMAILTPIVFLICGLTGHGWLQSFLFALSVAVGLTPELLPMVINACLARGSSQMGKKRTVVKSVNAMQNFGSMDMLCVDKTGTLTGNTVRLEYYLDILGNESDRVLGCAFLNSFYHSGVTDHLDKAVLKCMNMPGKGEYFQSLAASFPLLDELPFDYNRKFASVLLKGEEKNLNIIKGSVDGVLASCRYVGYKNTVSDISADADAFESVHAVVDEMTEDGMKVLAVACRETESELLTGDEDGYILIGYLGFFDAPKKSAAFAIKKLKDLQVDVRVLTGDELETAVSVCKRLGVDTKNTLTGDQVDKLSDNDLPIIAERTRIFAELTPRQKMRIVDILQANGHTVGFLGDGMNDLPSELAADVGISVDTAVEAVRESADVVLLKKDLQVLEEGILEGRKAFSNMTKYIRITASSNFGNICAVVAASVFLPFFPMTSVQLLLLNLLYDLLCLALPWDNVDSEMLEQPIKWSGKALQRFMLRFGPVSSVFDVLTFLFLFFFLCPNACGAAFGALDAAGKAQFITLFQTGWFLESLWTQVLILHLLRTRKVFFAQSRPSRIVLLVTLLGVVLFTILTVTPLGELFGLFAMPAGYYFFLVVDVILYFFAVSLAKRLYYRKFN